MQRTKRYGKQAVALAFTGYLISEEVFVLARSRWVEIHPLARGMITSFVMLAGFVAYAEISVRAVAV